MKGQILRGDEFFPDELIKCTEDVKELFYDGNKDLLKGICIAVVGSRKCTEYGKTVARNIGKRVSECGCVLVSGLAKGIDTAAHMGAIEGGGRTIAVLGNGTDICYPAENRNLQERIRKEGLLISEYPEGMKAKPYMFPRRNRIISGISQSIVITEARDGSGALITAELAMEQGKRLYAVPGNITSYYSFGTNKLIRENVTPLILIDDLFLDLGVSLPEEDPVLEKLGEEEKLIYEVLQRNGEQSVEEICHKTNINPSKINGIITILEMKGVIFSSLGKFFVAKFR